MAVPRALLFEDDPSTAAAVREWLVAAGWEVVHADTGADGVRRFEETRPALVLAELRLPGVDGATLCAHLRLSPYGGRARIVLLSAREDARDAALAAGADAFLATPLARDELYAAIAPAPAAPSADADAGAPHPGAVRVPRADVLGNSGIAGGQLEEGGITAGWFVPLLRRLHGTGFSGVLEAEGDEGLRAKLYFSRGLPAACRSTDARTGFGQVLLALRIVSEAHLEASIEEGRQSGVPLGEVLLRTGLIERRAVERALREQVLLRAVGIGRLTGGRYALDSAEPLGLAGFDVHPAAIAWRLDEVAPALDEAGAVRFVRSDARVAALWPLLDPDNRLGLLRALLVGGAAAGDCARVCGARSAALLAVLRAWALVELVQEPPPPASREAGLAELDASGLAAALYTEHRALLDANHYTVLGLQPDADADEVSAATAAALARLHPDALPAGLDPASRGRARDVYERALEAGRVLADPSRRAIYDARLGGEAHVRHGHIDMEDHAVLQADRAGELLRRGEFVTAAALFHMATQLEGESADILAMLGWARRHACPEDPRAGEAELRRAHALDPEDEIAAYYLARLLLNAGDVAEARRLLRAAVERNHEFEPARAALRELPE